MCGLAGAFGGAAARLEGTVARMVQSLRHRGPDDAGLWCGNEVVLGHRRLAVLDPSAAGHQPMVDASGRLHAVLNGEVYNFASLRAELMTHGYRFQTGTDTEVVLAGYHRYGPSLPERLLGMFSLAIHDAAPPRGWPQLFLCRDGLGIKPLLYAEVAGALLFASELRAMLLGAPALRHVDAAAVTDYFASGAVPQPRTLMRRVRALPPGCSLLVDAQDQTLRRHWDLHEATAALRDELQHVDEDAARERLQALLHEAAQAHAVADVPVGAFLSGGLDSAAVVALSAPHLKGAVRTFCLGFAPGPDERQAAARTAQHLGTRHTAAVVHPESGDEIFADVAAAIDQPSCDGTNTYLVAKLAKAHCKVVLSGLGADEFFGGYPHYRWAVAARHRPALASAARAAWNVVSHPLLARAAFLHGQASERSEVLRRLLSDTRRRSVLGRRLTPYCAPVGRTLPPPDADPVQALTYIEANDYLPNTLLRDADAMSMAHGIELRPLFLHRPLVEYAYALPARLKVTPSQGKRILLRAMGTQLPEHVRLATKRGFELPQALWMRQPALRRRLETLLHDDNAQVLLTARYRRDLCRRLRAGRPPSALWAYGILLQWLADRNLQV